MADEIQNQWKAKKQTLEQKREARIAKLDPDNFKSALDVMDEKTPEGRARLKRKREELDKYKYKDFDTADTSLLDQDQSDDEQDETQGPKAKKQKRSSNVSKSTEATGEESVEDRKRRKAEQRAAKRARKSELKAKQKEKKEQQKAKKKSDQLRGNTAGANELNLKEAITFETSSPPPQDEDEEGAEEEDEDEDTDQASIHSLEDEQSQVFSPQHESGTSSTSSIQPSTLEDTLQPSNKPTDTATPATTTKASTRTTQESSSTPRERLQAAIQQRRAERKADSTDSHAPKNRQELLEQRRRKEEQRKAAKKEQKRREKEEEARRQDEEIARRFSPGGSGSLLASPRSPVSLGDNAAANNNFSFGRIAFSDGTQLDPSAADIVEEHKRKGPRDTAAQLKIALAKKNKLSGLDEAKRQEIEQKDMWLNAKKRAHGEHVRDDTSLLKKALKRQQGQKKKSEREWTDRIQGVQKAQEARQKKRTDNLAKRKEDKRSSSKSGGGAGGAGKKVKRPGFEGSFKGRTGGRKK
ncbi:hypothetical protein RBB50_000040 [Rhinocladiella similis]